MDRCSTHTSPVNTSMACMAQTSSTTSVRDCVLGSTPTGFPLFRSNLAHGADVRRQRFVAMHREQARHCSLLLFQYSQLRLRLAGGMQARLLARHCAATLPLPEHHMLNDTRSAAPQPQVRRLLNLPQRRRQIKTADLQCCSGGGRNDTPNPAEPSKTCRLPQLASRCLARLCGEGSPQLRTRAAWVSDHPPS